MNRIFASAATWSPTLATPLTSAEARLSRSAVDFQPELVAGDDRPAELDAVDRDDQGRARPWVDDVGDQDPAAWARASTIRTPGMIGRPGQCPWKNGSLR